MIFTPLHPLPHLLLPGALRPLRWPRCGKKAGRSARRGEGLVGGGPTPPSASGVRGFGANGPNGRDSVVVACRRATTRLTEGANWVEGIRSQNAEDVNIQPRIILGF